MASSSTGNGPGPPSDPLAADPGDPVPGGGPVTSGDMSTAAPAAADSVEVEQGCCAGGCSPHRRKVGLGVLLMTVGAVCWVGTTQTARRTYQSPTFYAPFFLVYFSTSWLLIFYPLYLAVRFACAKGKISLGETFREAVRAYGEEEWTPCPYKVFAKCAGFTFLWDLAAYVYVRALSFKGALDVTALFATNANFVYLMSWIVLQKKFIAVRIVAFIVGMTGTILLIYMQSGFASDDMWGAILVIIATASAAAYKVLFRKIIGDVPLGQVSFFISCLGVFNAVTMWPLFLLLYFTKAEPIDWLYTPWVLLCATAAFMIGCKLVLVFGVEVSYPLLLQAMFILAIPICLVSEVILDLSHFSVSGMQIGAYLLIIASFFVNILPDNWHDRLLKALHVKRRSESPDDAHLTPRQRLRHSNPPSGGNP